MPPCSVWGIKGTRLACSGGSPPLGAFFEQIPFSDNSISILPLLTTLATPSHLCRFYPLLSRDLSPYPPHNTATPLYAHDTHVLQQFLAQLTYKWAIARLRSQREERKSTSACRPGSLGKSAVRFPGHPPPVRTQVSAISDPDRRWPSECGCNTAGLLYAGVERVVGAGMWAV